MVTPVQSDAPQILNFGPIFTYAGSGFNIQPNGNSVMWFKVANTKSNVIVRIDDEKLNAYLGNDLLTCTIPKKFFTNQGEHKIYLYDVASGLTSNIVIFTVK